MSEQINLLDEKVFNLYIKDIVYNNGQIDVFGSKEINDPEWVKSNKDKVIKALVFKYLKLQLRKYLSDSAGNSFLSEKEFVRTDWADEIKAKGDKIVEFDASNVPSDFREKIVRISKFLQSYGEKYIDQQLSKSEKIEMGGLSTMTGIESFRDALSAYREYYFNRGKNTVLGKIITNELIKKNNQNG